jgi:hypothetical protein
VGRHCGGCGSGSPEARLAGGFDELFRLHIGVGEVPRSADESFFAGHGG